MGRWCVFMAIMLTVASRMVLVPGALAGDLFLFAGSGAGFSLLAFDGFETRPGKAQMFLALAVTVLVILGSIWMAGRWGGAARVPAWTGALGGWSGTTAG